MTTTYTDNGTNTPNGSHLDFTFTFPVLQTEDVKVALNGVTQATTKYSVSTSPTAKITFNNTSVDSTVQNSTGAPKGGVVVRVYRQTTVHKNNGDSDPKAVFSIGSSIRSGDLNNNVDQALYGIAELQEKKLLAENIEDDAILSSHIKDGEIVDADINASAAISHSKIATGLLPSGITVNSSNIVDNSIVDADVNTGANIQGSKLADDSVALTKLGGGTLPSDIVVTRTNIENRTIQDIDIEEGTLDNRYYTETELNNGQLDNQYYTETELNNGQLDNRYFTETELNGGVLDTRYYTEQQLDGGQLNNLYYTESELDGGQLDNRYFTETESDARYFRQDSTETIASGDAWSASDSKVATTGAIDLRIIDLVDDVGGFTPIANETSFPTANPDVNNGTGTIVSVKAASTNLTAQSGTTLTITNGAGTGNTVTITGLTSTIPSGYGFLVETTTTLHTYTFHRLVPKATEVSTIAANAVNIAAAGANVTDIHNFADLYQISTSAPINRADGSNLVAGDLWYDSSSNKVLMIYDGSSGDGFSAATPNASDLANISIVAGQITFTEDLGLITNALTTQTGNTTLNTVAGIATDVTTVAGIQANVTAVAADATDIGAVAGKATEIGRLGTADAVADMNTLGTTAIVSDMDTLADISSDITTVAGISSNVTAVVGNATNINAVNANATNINAVNANSSNINTVSGINADVTTVAGISSNVTAVAGNATNINAVAADATDIGAVAGKATEIGRLGTADAVADLAILGTTDAVADMNTLATTAIVSDMDTLADISTNITSVANIDSNVTTVAGIAANVTTAAGNNAAITTVAGNNANITTVANANSNVSTVAGSIANVNTAASNVTNINNFANRYRIDSSDPGTNNDQGDLYFNTTSNELRVYNGSAWQGGVTATGNLAGLGANTFTGAQTFASGQTFDGRDVSADGAKLDAITTSSGVIVNGVTATTQSASDNSTKLATTAYTDTAIANLVDSSPSALNTLNELAAAIGDDANFSTTITNSLATKLATNGDGSNVTNLNASNIASGTIAAARVPTLNQNTTGSAELAYNVHVNANNSTNEDVYLLFADAATGTQGCETDTALAYNPSTNTLSAGVFNGSGASLTSLNASNISSGTIAAARVATLNQNTTGSSASCTGNAATATALANARTISGASFDGTANITLNNANITNGAGYITSADGGNAATLDGIDSANFLRSDTADLASGDISFNGGAGAVTIKDGSDIRFESGTWTGNAYAKIQYHNNSLYIQGGSNTNYSWIFRYDANDRIYVKSNGDFYPAADSTSDLGTSGNRWANCYADTYYGSGSGLTDVVKNATNSNHVLRFGDGTNTGHSVSSYPYAIFQESGAWNIGGGGSGYPDLRINYHTGIVLAAHQNYGGVRFQRDYNDTTELMSIGNSDNHVRVAYNLYVSGDQTNNGWLDIGGIVNNTGAGAVYGRNHLYDTVELRGYGAEFMIGAQHQSIHINYRTCNNGTTNHTPATWYWRKGSSSNWSDHHFGDVNANGNVTATGNVTAYSDARLKTNVKTIDNALNIVDQLRGVSFDWKESGKHSVGVIAQEVEAVLPELVETIQENTGTKEEPEYREVKTVDYGKMVGVLINAIKELRAEVAELKEGK